MARVGACGCLNAFELEVEMEIEMETELENEGSGTLIKKEAMKSMKMKRVPYIQP